MKVLTDSCRLLSGLPHRWLETSQIGKNKLAGFRQTCDSGLKLEVPIALPAIIASAPIQPFNNFNDKLCIYYKNVRGLRLKMRGFVVYLWM